MRYIRLGLNGTIPVGGENRSTGYRPRNYLVPSAKGENPNSLGDAIWDRPELRLLRMPWTGCVQNGALNGQDLGQPLWHFKLKFPGGKPFHL